MRRDIGHSLLVVICAVVIFMAACSNDARTPTPPLILPFAVQQAGAKVETSLRVVEHRPYIFSLRLSFEEGNERDRARVKKLAGDFGRDQNGSLLEPGVSVPLRIVITAVDRPGEAKLIDKEVLEEEMWAYGADNFKKRIAIVQLEPGVYRISVESLRDVPELVGTSVELGIGYDRKATPIQ